MQSGLTAVVERPFEALSIFVGTFFVLSILLTLIDFIPEAPGSDVTVTTPSNTNPTVTLSEVSTIRAKNLNLIAGPAPVAMPSRSGALPTRVVIPKVGVDINVVEPSGVTLEVLDGALLKGAAYYPGTSLLNEEGATLLFGHQSYLPVVHNKAFKAFNDVQKLSAGDVVIVYAGQTEYRFAVRSATLTTTEIGTIPLETKGKTLVLVTCNSLGAKEERNIIVADLIN